MARSEGAREGRVLTVKILRREIIGSLRGKCRAWSGREKAEGL